MRVSNDVTMARMMKVKVIYKRNWIKCPQLVIEKKSYKKKEVEMEGKAIAC